MGLVLGLVVVCVEWYGSRVSGSLGLLADGAHAMVDVLFYAFAIYVQRRLYSRPEESEHLWERRGDRLNALLFFATAGMIFVEALRRGTETSVDAGTMAAVGFVGMLLNLGQWGVVELSRRTRTSRQINLHNLGDALQSGVVCLVALLSRWGDASTLDLCLSVGLGAYFAWQGIAALRGGHSH